MATFRIDQATPGAGVAGRSRHDLINGEVITLTATDPAPGAGITYSWEILDKRGSVAVLSSSTGQSVTIGSAGSIVRPSSFLIELTAVTPSGTTKTRRIASVRTAVAQLRVPVFPETSPDAQKLSLNTPDLSTDNASYANRSGLGVTEQNAFGWSEWAWEVVAALETSSGTLTVVAPTAPGATATINANAVEGASSLTNIDTPAGEPVSAASPYYLRISDGVFSEYVVVTNIAGAVRTLAGPLRRSYAAGPSTTAYCGPATTPGPAGLMPAGSLHSLLAAVETAQTRIFNKKVLDTPLSDGAVFTWVAANNRFEPQVPTPPATTLWRWNETDASQFVVSLDEIASGGGGPVLSKVAGAEGPRLRVAFPTKVNGLNLCVISISDLSLPVIQTDMRRYVFRFRIVGRNTGKTAAEWYSVGAALCNNGGVGAALYCQIVTTDWAGNADRTGQISAGAKTLAGATPGWGAVISASTDFTTYGNNALCVPFKLDVTQRHQAASPPDWRGELHVDVPNAAGKLYKNATRAAVTAVTTAVGAAWNTEVFDTLGLAFLGTTGTQTDHYFELDQLRVEIHPMDLP